MKETVLCIILTACLFITGCSTTGPCTPKQHPEKYAFQALWIEIPADQVKQSHPHQFSHDEIEKMLKNPKAILTEFPVVYAAVGEPAVNDQTKTIPAHETYEVKTNSNGGIEVVYVDGTARIGRSAEITIQKVKSNDVTCALNIYGRSLNGTQEYAVAPATKTQKSVTASLPMFKVIGIKTSITVSSGSWVSMGGLIRNRDGKFSSEEKKEPQIGSTKVFSFIRILPPKAN